MLDLISDTLTRIKNAQNVRCKSVLLHKPLSKFCMNILNILYKEGFIRGFHLITSDKNNIVRVKVLLKYDSSGQPTIKQIKRISKPGRRFYIPIKSLWKINNGIGILILSTPKGLMTDEDARLLNVGGEVLCKIN